MTNQVQIQGPRWKIIIPATLLVAITMIVLIVVFQLQLQFLVWVLVVAIALITAFHVLRKFVDTTHYIFGICFDMADRYQDHRHKKYRADKAGFEAKVLSFPQSQRQLVSSTAPVRLIEATSYKEIVDAENQEPLDLLTVFTQPTQSYACIGGQQTGKTYQMRHIAAYWLNRGIHPVVIGPKWDKGEWRGCHLVGGNGDFAEVSRGIARVSQIAQERHQSDLRHKEHSILPVFFDDWTPIVDAVNNAREMVLQATTLYASVNIILYFILHSDTANAWGVDRKGAALKDNFIKLFIVPHYDTTGLIVRDKTKGFIKFAGDSTEYPVKLFSGPVNESAMMGGYFINLEVEPNATEAAVLNMFDEGCNRNEITEAVFNSRGGNQYKKIEEILSKFGRAYDAE